MDLEVLLARAAVPNEEDVVIALHPPRWDFTLNRGTKSIFEKPNTSVSRLAISHLDEILACFKRTIQGGNVDLKGYGTIKVEKIKAIGAAATNPIDFEVTIDPVKPSTEDPIGNPAHAELIPFSSGRKEIKARVSDGVCKSLATALDVTQL